MVPFALQNSLRITPGSWPSELPASPTLSAMTGPSRSGISSKMCRPMSVGPAPPVPHRLAARNTHSISRSYTNAPWLTCVWIPTCFGAGMVMHVPAESASHAHDVGFCSPESHQVPVGYGAMLCAMQGHRQHPRAVPRSSATLPGVRFPKCRW